MRRFTLGFGSGLLLAAMLLSGAPWAAAGAGRVHLMTAGAGPSGTSLDELQGVAGDRLDGAPAGPAFGDRLGSWLAAAGSASAAAAVAIGHALLAGAAAAGHGLAWLGSAVATGVSGLVHGLGSLAIHAARGLGSAFVAIGHGLAAALTFLGSMALDLVGGLGSAWPSDPRHQAIVAGAGAASAAAGGAAWYARAWRYLGAIPLLAPLYARIARENLLEHPLRARVYEAVRAHPGVFLSELQRTLGLPWGTLLHHLEKLERGSLVVSTTANGKRCLFLPGQVAGDQRRILPALEHRKARAIAEYFAANPGASQSEASDALAISPALLSWHVRRLERAGVVTRERRGRTQHVGIRAEALAAIVA